MRKARSYLFRKQWRAEWDTSLGLTADLFAVNIQIKYPTQ